MNNDQDNLKKAHNVLCNAISFLDAANIILKNANSCYALSAPQSLLCVHSMELSFKSALIFKNIEVKSHNLVNLFEKVLKTYKDIPFLGLEYRKKENICHFLRFIDRNQNSIMSRYNDGKRQPLFLMKDVTYEYAELFIFLMGNLIFKDSDASYNIHGMEKMWNISKVTLWEMVGQFDWNKF